MTVAGSSSGRRDRPLAADAHADALPDGSRPGDSARTSSAAQSGAGLEPLPQERVYVTFGELMDWEWKRHGQRLRAPTIVAFSRSTCARSSAQPLSHRERFREPLAAAGRVGSRLHGDGRM